MSTRNNIIDATGSNYGAKVDKFNTLWVRDLGIPPTTDPDNPGGGLGEIQKVYREYLTRNGDGVTINMNVVGSLTSPALYYVTADPNFDIYITSLSFVVVDPNLTLQQFGNIGVLPNGHNLYYEDTNGTTFIGQSLKTNFDLVRLSQGNPAWGDPTGAFIANNVLGTAEGILPVLDFRKVFGLPYGIRLGAGTNDKIVLEIRDNLSAIDQFDIIAYGTRVRL